MNIDARPDRMIARIFLLLIIAAALVGCAGPEKVPLTQDSLKGIRSIAVVEIREPIKYQAINFGHPGMVFGAIGGAAAGAAMEANGTQLTEAMKANGFSVAKRLMDKTMEALTKLGYRVTRAPDTREQKDNLIVLDYRTVKTDADVILNIHLPIVGFTAKGLLSDYLPTVGATVELVRLEKEKADRIYIERIMYGWDTFAGSWINLPSPPQFSYSNFETLMSKHREAGEGIHVGVDAIVSKFADDFVKKP